MWAGDSLGVFVVSPLRVRPEQRAMPSTAWLMPSTRFWEADEVLVTTEHRNYTVNDYHQLFTDINYTDGYMLWNDTHNLIIGEFKSKVKSRNSLFQKENVGATRKQ